MSAFDLDDAPNWRGRDVIDRNGHEVGVITDIFVDDATGRPEWAGVRPGLFSHRETFLPLAQATQHGMRVQVPFDRQLIHDAPSMEPGGQLSAEEEARLYQHYGLEYEPAAGGAPSGAASEFVAPATDKLDDREAAEGGGLRLRRHVTDDQEADRAPGE